MWKLNYKSRNRGFTLIELLVTIGIIGILAGIATVTVGKIKGTSNQTKCISNLRGISQALQLYYNDYLIFPEDGYPQNVNDLYPLSTELSNYINRKSTFICPTDKDSTSISNFASYDPYYVARKNSYGEAELAVGCPRHRDAENSSSLFFSGSTEITKTDTVLVNGQEIPPDGSVAQKTISSGNDTMTFADGSTVTVTDASGGSYGCFLVQSVRLSDGTLYSIVKVQDNGIIDVEVTDGSKFEIVTPSAIVGVRGTEFTVQTSTNGTYAGYQTDVTLTSGIVYVLDRETGATTRLTLGGTTFAKTGDVPMHSHYHTHASGERHSHEHPSQNNAHHGKYSIAADDDDSSDDGSSDDPDADVTICHSPGTPWQTTMIIDSSYLTEHLAHGDTEDACVSDNDADGYTIAEGDCDDNDATVNPGATEVQFNGKDDDCDSETPDE